MKPIGESSHVWLWLAAGLVVLLILLEQIPKIGGTFLLLLVVTIYIASVNKGFVQ